jgi:GR25 family glycosyltransferase involved in LPS biosynthesis
MRTLFCILAMMVVQSSPQRLDIVRPFNGVDGKDTFIKFGKYFAIEISLVGAAERFGGTSATLCYELRDEAVKKKDHACVDFLVDAHGKSKEDRMALTLHTASTIVRPGDTLVTNASVTFSIDGFSVRSPPVHFRMTALVDMDDFLRRAYFINLDRNPGRREVIAGRLKSAGFKDIVRFPGVDGSLGTVDFDSMGIYHGEPGHKGCTLSHRLVWQLVRKYMLETGTPVVSIFEDDAVPHENFTTVIGSYVENIPPDADIIYSGWMRGGLRVPNETHPEKTYQSIDPETTIEEPHVVARHPACLHAYSLTLKGVTRLLEYSGKILDAVDMHVATLIYRNILKGYVFNGKLVAESRLPKRKARDQGIVFQDPDLGTNIDGYDKVLLMNQITKLKKENQELKETINKMIKDDSTKCIASN